MWLNGKVCSFTQKQLVKKHIFFALVKCINCYVLPTLAQLGTYFITFNLWINPIEFDTFVLLSTSYIMIRDLVMSLLVYLKLQILVELLLQSLWNPFWPNSNSPRSCLVWKTKAWIWPRWICLVYYCVSWCSSIWKAPFWHVFWTCDVKSLLICYEQGKSLSKHERGLFERCLISPSKKYHMNEKIKQREKKMGSCLLRVGLLP